MLHCRFTSSWPVQLSTLSLGPPKESKEHRPRHGLRSSCLYFARPFSEWHCSRTQQRALQMLSNPGTSDVDLHALSSRQLCALFAPKETRSTKCRPASQTTPACSPLWPECVLDQHATAASSQTSRTSCKSASVVRASALSLSLSQLGLFEEVDLQRGACHTPAPSCLLCRVFCNWAVPLLPLHDGKHPLSLQQHDCSHLTEFSLSSSATSQISSW